MVQPKIREGCQQISTNHLHDHYIHREQCTVAHCTVQNPTFTMRVLGSNTAQCTYCTSAQWATAHTSSCYPVLVHIDTQLCAISTHRALLTKLNTALPFVQCTSHPRTLDSPEITLVPSNLLPLVSSPLYSVLRTALRCGPLQMHLATILSADTNLHRRPPNPSRSLASFYFTSSQMFAEQKDLIRFRKHQQQANTFVTL